MANYMAFSSDNVNVFILILDCSYSMESEASKVRSGIEMFMKSFKGFSQAASVSVSISRFAGDFHPGEFRMVENLDTGYSLESTGTALYKAITKSSKYFKDYIAEVEEKTGTIPNATYIFLSDGEPCGDNIGTFDSAKKAITDMNLAGVTTAWVAFGEDVSAKMGKELGFMSTIEVVDRSTLEQFLGVELSKSCKEQSMSMKSLGANFFSHAATQSSSEEFSQKTDQSLNDTSWIDDI